MTKHNKPFLVTKTEDYVTFSARFYKSLVYVYRGVYHLKYSKDYFLRFLARKCQKPAVLLINMVFTILAIVAILYSRNASSWKSIDLIR